MFKIVDTFGNDLYEGKTFEQHLDIVEFMLGIPEEHRPENWLIKEIKAKNMNLEGFFKGFI